MTDEELDTLVAEKVMGWTRREYIRLECWGLGAPVEDLVRRLVSTWHPSTDIQDAWDAVEKIKSQRFGSSNNYPNFGVYDESAPNHPFIWVYFDEWEDDHRHGGTNVTVRAESYSSTLPRAICFAALRVVGAIEKHDGRTLLD